MTLTKKAARSADPTFEPVTMPEVKAHLRIAETNEDHHDSIARLIQVAREEFEGDTNYILSTGTFVYKLDDWPECESILLPVRPVSSITSIQYVDPNGTTQTFSSSNYSLNTTHVLPQIDLAYSSSWPATRVFSNCVTVTFVAGYSLISAIPARAKQACLIKVEQLFDGDQKELLSRTYEWLIKKFMRPTYP